MRIQLPTPLETETPPEPRSTLLRFLDTFLQERSIIWVLGIGMAILLGSSAMLVTTHWQSYAPLWKIVILLGYTALIDATGAICFNRLALRKTGTVLRALVTMLVPVLFLSMPFAGADTVIARVFMVAITLVYATISVGRIFSEFLGGTQPTFLISYLILSVSGAVIPSLRDQVGWISPLLGLFLWGVLCAGIIKVNRHCFWLAEKNQRPILFGFFPVALLASQFLAVFLTHLCGDVTQAQLGLGCVLLSVPIFLTANSVVHVHRQRTGDLIRPYPSSIILPLFVGILLAASGVVLTALPVLDGRVPTELTPAAAIAGVIFAVLARSTRMTPFVWGMLVSFTAAYNFSPAFFRETAARVAQFGADVVREDGLPYGFYGLTFFPLLLAGTLFLQRCKKKQEVFFAAPVSHFIIGLEVILLAASLTHFKTTFPVGAAMTLLLLLGTRAVKDRRMAFLTVASSLIAALGAVPFAREVLGFPVDPALTLTLPALLIFHTSLLGKRLDQSVFRWNDDCASSASPSHLASLIGTFLLATLWIIQATISPSISFLEIGTLVLLIGSFLLHCARTQKPSIGMSTVIFSLTAIHFLSTRMPLNAHLLLLTLSLATLHGARVLLTRRGTSALEVSLLPPIRSVLLRVVPVILLVHLGTPFFAVFQFDSPPLHTYFAQALIGFLALHQCSERERPIFSFVTLLASMVFILLALTDFMGKDSLSWIPAIAMGLGHLALPLLRRVHRLFEVDPPPSGYQGLPTLLRSARFLLCGLFVCVGSLSFLGFHHEIRIAGILAGLGLLLLARKNAWNELRVPGIAFLNGQLLSWIVQLTRKESFFVWEMTEHDLGAIFFAAASASLLLWRRMIPRSRQEKDLCMVIKSVLLVFLVYSLIATTFVPRVSFLEGTVFIGSLLVLAGNAIRFGCQRDNETYVWYGEALFGITIGWMAYQKIITFGNGTSQIILSILAFVAYGVARRTRTRENLNALQGPLMKTSLLLPAAAALLAVVRHGLGFSSMIPGLSSLGLLLASSFYFVYGMQTGRRKAFVGSIAILNVCTILLALDLPFSDPQLFLIPVGGSVLGLTHLFRKELSPGVKTALTYAGALIILVSPIFHIVTGSWFHLFSLMVLSALIVLAAVGLRIKALMWTGCAFLLADLVAMVVRGSIDHPNLLWFAGLGFGGLVMSLGALAERNREHLLQRVRALSAALKAWN